MSTAIITCGCGASVRVPTDSVGRSFCCPKCKASVAVTPNSIPITTSRVDVDQKATCPICRTAMQANEESVTCPTCGQIHHKECWAEVGGCGTYGCAHAPAQDKSEQSVQAPLSAWGDTKVCPACGETIKSIALRCRFCSTDFGSVDPLTTADLRLNAIRNVESDRFKKIVVANFVVSIIGCLAPLTLIFGLAYLLPKRDKLAKCGPLFVIMGWTSIVLSGVYCVLLILFFLAGNLP